MVYTIVYSSSAVNHCDLCLEFWLKYQNYESVTTISYKEPKPSKSVLLGIS